MKPYLACMVVFLLVTSSARAQSDETRAIDLAPIKQYYKNTALKAKALLPKQLQKSAEAKGDLDGDGIDDIAMIVHEAGRAIPNKDYGDNHEMSSSLQLVLIFKGNEDGSFQLWKLGSKHFIEATSYFMEPYGVGLIAIKNRVLTMQSLVAMSMGGWGAGGCTTKWRHEPAGLRLIGLSDASFGRNTGVFKKYDTNFLTGRSVYTSNEDPETMMPLEKDIERVKQTKPSVILWEAFNYERMCSEAFFEEPRDSPL